MAEAVLQKPLRRVRVEAEYLDFGAPEQAAQRFRAFRSQVDLLSLTPEYAANVQSASARTQSPGGVFPVAIQVDMVVAGRSWVEVKQTAQRLVSQAARLCGITIAEEVGGETPADGVYLEGDLQLAGARRSAS